MAEPLDVLVEWNEGVGAGGPKKGELSFRSSPDRVDYRSLDSGRLAFFTTAEARAFARAVLTEEAQEPAELWAAAVVRVTAALEGLAPRTTEDAAEEAQLDARLRAAKVAVYAQRSLDGLLAGYVMSAHPRSPGLPSVDVNDYTALADSAFAAGEAMMRKEEILTARRERLLGKTAEDTGAMSDAAPRTLRDAQAIAPGAQFGLGFSPEWDGHRLQRVPLATSAEARAQAVEVVGATGEWMVLPGTARYTVVGPPERVKALEEHKLATVFDACCVSHPATPELGVVVADDAGGRPLAQRVAEALNRADLAFRQASARAPTGSPQPDGGLTAVAIAESLGGVRWCAVGVRSSYGGPPQLTLQPIACAGERLDGPRLTELTKDLLESARLMRLIVVEVEAPARGTASGGGITATGGADTKTPTFYMAEVLLELGSEMAHILCGLPGDSQILQGVARGAGKEIFGEYTTQEAFLDFQARLKRAHQVVTQLWKAGLDDLGARVWLTEAKVVGLEGRSPAAILGGGDPLEVSAVLGAAVSLLSDRAS